MYVLNLTHSPENSIILGVSRSFHIGRRRNKKRVYDERGLSPRGLRQHRVAQRIASNRASDEQGLLGRSAMQHPSMTANVKRGVQTAASQVMRTGTPQWLAKKRGNARRAKVLTDGRPLKRKHCRYARSE